MWEERRGTTFSLLLFCLFLSFLFLSFCTSALTTTDAGEGALLTMIILGNAANTLVFKSGGQLDVFLSLSLPSSPLFQMAEDEAVKELQDAIRCDEAKAKSLLESAGGNVDSVRARERRERLLFFLSSHLSSSPTPLTLRLTPVPYTPTHLGPSPNALSLHRRSSCISSKRQGLMAREPSLRLWMMMIPPMLSTVS